MVTLRLRPQRPSFWAFALGALLVASPAGAGPDRAAKAGVERQATAHPPRVKSVPPVAGNPKIDALHDAVYAFVAERECDDLAVDYRGLERRMRVRGLKPEDLGPNSPYGPALDRFRQDISDLFLENRRHACERAWDLVGKPDDEERAPRSSRL